MSSIKKPKRVADPVTMQCAGLDSQAVPDPVPATAMQARDPVDDYMDRNYPGLARSWDVTELLHVLIRETIKTRLENGRRNC